jgi:putative ABC transport system permease protein
MCDARATRSAVSNNESLSARERTALAPATMTTAIRAAVHEIAPDAMVSAAHMDVSGFAAQQRFVTVFIGGFAGLALVLALVGVYGVMHSWVAERVHEIGVRMVTPPT